jgi:hypothetical protein
MPRMGLDVPLQTAHDRCGLAQGTYFGWLTPSSTDLMT